MYIALLINFKLLRRKREERRGDDGEWFFVTRNIEVKEKINPSTRMIITMMTITMMMISLSRWRAIRSRVHSTYAILEFVRFSIPSLFANFSPNICIYSSIDTIFTFVHFEFVAANCKLASISNEKRKKKSINGELFFNCIPRMFAERRRVLLFVFFFRIERVKQNSSRLAPNDQIKADCLRLWWWTGEDR